MVSNPNFSKNHRIQILFREHIVHANKFNTPASRAIEW